MIAPETMSRKTAHELNLTVLVQWMVIVYRLPNHKIAVTYESLSGSRVVPSAEDLGYPGAQVWADTAVKTGRITTIASDGTRTDYWA